MAANASLSRIGAWFAAACCGACLTMTFAPTADAGLIIDDNVIDRGEELIIEDNLFDRGRLIIEDNLIDPRYLIIEDNVFDRGELDN